MFYIEYDRQSLYSLHATEVVKGFALEAVSWQRVWLDVWYFHDCAVLQGSVHIEFGCPEISPPATKSHLLHAVGLFEEICCFAQLVWSLVFHDRCPAK